ncbi:MAG TPA: SurA N-terminal domain-containing protein [Candidatus Binatia bacterium]|nr:SurA N-terminal domain-containing protein [Candidatus Binatia bacterium]
MKLPRPKKLTEGVKQRLPKRKPKDPKVRLDEAIQSLPRITNDTIAAHREEVIGSARKYIYPLRQSLRRAVTISISIILVFIIGFFTYVTLALYRFQSNSSFLYSVTQVLPFPIAKVGPSWVSYENYLFELRHYEHYYETQQKVDFSTQAGQQQLNNYKQEAMDEIIDDALIKQLAAKNNISVSNQEVDNEITLVRNQDQLGSNEKVFENVLSEFWGWTLGDFKRELKQQLLAQKVVGTLDTATHQRAQAALSALQHGASFASVAAQYSDDTATKNNGGQFNGLISQTDQNVPPQTLQTLFSLKPGQTSGIINIGSGLEIDEVISAQSGQVQAAHILFNFQSIDSYLAPLKAKEKPHIFISQNQQ